MYVAFGASTKPPTAKVLLASARFRFIFHWHWWKHYGTSGRFFLIYNHTEHRPSASESFPFRFPWFLHILSPSECCKSRFFASALGCIAQRRKTNAKDAPPHLPHSFPPGCTVAKGKLIIWKYYLRAIMLKYGAFDNSSTQTNKDTQPYKRHTTMHNTPTCVHRCIRTRQRTWRLLFGGHNLTWSPITCPSAPSPSTGTLLSRTKQRTAKPSQTRDKAKTVSY